MGVAPIRAVGHCSQLRMVVAIDSSSKREMGEQIRLEPAECCHQLIPRGIGRCVIQVGGRPFDIVEEVRDRPMIRLQLVDDRCERRVRTAQRRKHVRVLVAVVRVHDSAVIEAIHSQRPDGAARLQRGDLVRDAGSRRSRRDLLGQRPAHLEIAAKHAVDELELTVHEHPERLLAELPGRHVRADARAARRPPLHRLCRRDSAGSPS